MIFGKKDHLVGLDIGSSLIKVAELKKNRQGLCASKIWNEPDSTRDNC